jgi:NAD(P)-dependent dehydrogenase (short-subunit alcohol dehydrogenase family)
MSAPLSPAARTRTSTSPGPGSGSGRSWTDTSPSAITAARIAPQSNVGVLRPISDSTILVTGATDGLGQALAQRLHQEGAQLLLHGRDGGKLDAVAAELPGAQTLQADFASLDDVRRLAGEVEHIDVLVNNAGIGSGMPEGRERAESRDGYELRFQVNYLSGYLLTELLLDKLRTAAPARVVFVASLGQMPIDFDDVMLERNYSGIQAYCQSKLAEIAYGMALAGRLDPEEVTVNSLHPSTFMPTKMVLAERGTPEDPLERGVEATYRLVADPSLDGVSGRFFDREEETAPHPWALDPRNRERLVEISQELTA